MLLIRKVSFFFLCRDVPIFFKKKSEGLYPSTSNQAVSDFEKLRLIHFDAG